MTFISFVTTTHFLSFSIHILIILCGLLNEAELSFLLKSVSLKSIFKERSNITKRAVKHLMKAITLIYINFHTSHFSLINGLSGFHIKGMLNCRRKKKPKKKQQQQKTPQNYKIAYHRVMVAYIVRPKAKDNESVNQHSGNSKLTTKTVVD